MKTTGGKTALMFAVENEKTAEKVINTLLSAGADVVVTSNTGATLATLIARANFIPSSLRDLIFTKEREEAGRRLVEELARGKTELVEELIARDATEYRDPAGNSALFYAAKLPTLDTFFSLLATTDFDPFLTNHKKLHAIHMIARRDEMEATFALLSFFEPLKKSELLTKVFSGLRVRGHLSANTSIAVLKLIPQM